MTLSKTGSLAPRPRSALTEYNLADGLQSAGGRALGWQGPALTHILFRFSSYDRILVTSQSPDVMDCMLSLLLLGWNTDRP